MTIVQELPESIDTALKVGTWEPLDPAKENEAIKEMTDNALLDSPNNISPSPSDCDVWALYEHDNIKIREHLKYTKSVHYDERSLVLRHTLHGEYPEVPLFEPRAKHIVIGIKPPRGNPYQIIFEDTTFVGVNGSMEEEKPDLGLDVTYTYREFAILPMEKEDQ